MTAPDTDTGDVECPKCAGNGWMRWTLNGRRAVPCHWFRPGAFVCEDCDGTGVIAVSLVA